MGDAGQTGSEADPQRATEPPSLDYLGPVASTSAYLRRSPASEAGRRRRDEAVRRAVRFHPLAVVAEAAGLSPGAVASILVDTAPGRGKSDR
jgi:hypothetical protein